jgi:hypothetical protein
VEEKEEEKIVKQLAIIIIMFGCKRGGDKK